MFECFVMFFLSVTVGSYAALPSHGWLGWYQTTHCAHCTLHTAKLCFALYTAHCTLHTVHCTLHTAQSCSDTVHSLLYTAHCTVMSGYCVPWLCTVKFRAPLVSLWSILIALPSFLSPSICVLYRKLPAKNLNWNNVQKYCKGVFIFSLFLSSWSLWKSFRY